MVQNLATTLRCSSFGFREVYAERQVNNIYYDTPLFRFFNENVQGVADRKKIRLRWYGTASLPETFRFEIKRKAGLVGTKSVQVLKIGARAKQHIDDLEKLDIPEEFRWELVGTRPTLFNCYKRRYFLSANGKFRATMDYHLTYSHPSVLNLNTHGSRDSEAVLELKYNHEFDPEAGAVADELPFRFTKKSKYVSGISAVYGC